MDKIVVCPECGAQMTLQDGQVVFSCVDCGTRLYCIKGVVITKSQAKLLLKKLVEKKQAEKARQLEIERISAKNVNETVRPEPPMPMTTSTSLSLWIFFAAFWIRENSSLS